MKVQLRLVSLSALALTSLLVPAQAAPILLGDLFFTTFQNQSGNPALPQSTNVWKVSFTYNPGSLTYTVPVAVKQLTGADGLIFDPNDSNRTTLLIGEQNSNKVAQMATSGSPLLEKKADGSAAIGFGLGQAYGVIATPDKSKLLMMPNDPSPNPTGINVAPLNPLGDGTAHCVAVTDHPIVGVDFDKAGVAYFGTAPDQLRGTFGILGNLGASNPSCFTVTPSVIVDDVNPGAPVANGNLPVHGVTFDAFSSCFLVSSSNQIWQLCPDATVANKFHIVAKVATPTLFGGFGCMHPANNPSCNSNNWDQISADGQGHMFAANNNGDVIFIDFQATGKISTATFSSIQFLAIALDDLVNGGGAPPPPVLIDGRMTGGGSVFTSAGQRVTHGFEIHCDVKDVPNRLEINWDGGNNFHLETMTAAVCLDDPKIDSGHPRAPFDTYIGTGIGKLNGVFGATVSFTFTDAGEPGKDDTATIVIKDVNNQVVLTVSGNLDKGNQQAHVDNK